MKELEAENTKLKRMYAELAPDNVAMNEDKAWRKDGTLSRSDFQWNAHADEYRCPKASHYGPRARQPQPTRIYRSSVYDCMGCELKSLCGPNTTHRKIARQVNEAVREVARQIGDYVAIATVPQGSQEGRVVVRAPVTHPAAGSIAASRAARRPR